MAGKGMEAALLLLLLLLLLSSLACKSAHANEDHRRCMS